MQQTLLSKNELRFLSRRTHGGRVRKRKSARPLICGAVTHIVLKSSQAKGPLSFYRNKQLIAYLLRERSRKYFVEILDFVNMGNHLHLKVRFKSKIHFQNFLRTFTAILARAITRARRGITF